MEQNNHKGALQHPIGSGFNASTTAKESIKGIDLRGKIAVVTGGYTGIGLETTKTLTSAGATVIVPARNLKKAKANLAGIKGVELEELDLMDPGSIDRFANKFMATARPLHLLINNAGIMFVPLRRNSSGNESQLTTNYLSVFQLTARLWVALKRADGARVVNVSSQGHQFSDFDFGDPNFKTRSYDTLTAYGQSKTAVNLFSLELDQRGKPYGVRAYSLHPGNIWGTELIREAPMELLQNFGLYNEHGEPDRNAIASLKTIPQGAATTIWAATSQELDAYGGVYCEDSDIAELALGQEFSQGVKPYSLDPTRAKQLWKWTENTTGISFIPG